MRRFFFRAPSICSCSHLKPFAPSICRFATGNKNEPGRTFLGFQITNQTDPRIIPQVYLGVTAVAANVIMGLIGLGIFWKYTLQHNAELAHGTTAMGTVAEQEFFLNQGKISQREAIEINKTNVVNSFCVQKELITNPFHIDRNPASFERLKSIIQPKKSIGIWGIYGVKNQGKTELIKQIVQEIEQLNLRRTSEPETPSQRTFFNWLMSFFGNTKKTNINQERKAINPIKYIDFGAGVDALAAGLNVYPPETIQYFPPRGTSSDQFAFALTCLVNQLKVNKNDVFGGDIPVLVLDHIKCLFDKEDCYNVLIDSVKTLNDYGLCKTVFIISDETKARLLNDNRLDGRLRLYSFMDELSNAELKNYINVRGIKTDNPSFDVFTRTIHDITGSRVGLVVDLMSESTRFDLSSSKNKLEKTMLDYLFESMGESYCSKIIHCEGSTDDALRTIDILHNEAKKFKQTGNITVNYKELVKLGTIVDLVNCNILVRNGIVYQFASVAEAHIFAEERYCNEMKTNVECQKRS